MIDTKSIATLNKFKLQVDKLVYKSGRTFSVRLNNDDPTNPCYAYVIDEVWFGFVYSKSGKFHGVVCDMAKYEHMFAEGFTEQEIYDNAEVFFEYKNSAAFVKALVRG